MTKKLFALLAIFMIVVLSLTACKADPWKNIGTEDNPIIFAAVPSVETERVMTGFEKVADMIFDATGMVIEPFVATSYTAAIEALCADPPQAHMGALSTFSYILAAEKGCVETALVSTRNERPFYKGQFLVHVDSGLEKLEDLAGKTYCRVDVTSGSGWIVPSIMLKGVGINPETDLDEIVDAGSQGAVAAGVYNGSCDFGTTYVDARDRVEEDYPDIMDKTVVIALQPEIPMEGIQFHTDFPVDIKVKLVAAFLALYDTEEGAAAMEGAYGWSGMQEHDDTFYDAFRQILDAAGVSAAEIAAED